MDKFETYLGDGVYASFDGYHINLAVNHHANHAVALDPNVIDRLEEYIAFIKSQINQEKQ